MRTIKFRGKRLDNDEWVYGFLYQLELLPCGGLGTMILTDDDNCESDAISPFNLAFRKGVDLFMVDTDTVGQFTGLTDKNGKEIYEGDILECYYDREVNPGVVVYVQGAFCLVPNKGKDEPLESLQDFLVGSESGYEVIGNIHDNPELIEEGGKA